MSDYEKVSKAFKKLLALAWSEPPIPPYDPDNVPRDYYKAALLRMHDSMPNATIQEMAYTLVRSVGWCAEALMEALKERDAELWSMLVEP